MWGHDPGHSKHAAGVLKSETKASPLPAGDWMQYTVGREPYPRHVM